jgi:hypothetical protein
VAVISSFIDIKPNSVYLTGYRNSHLSSTASLQVLRGTLALGVVLVAVVGDIAEGINDRGAVLLALLAGVCSVLVDAVAIEERRRRRRRCILGLERFALWPWTLLEMFSRPWLSSCISSEMTDLLPAESIVIVGVVGSFVIVIEAVESKVSGSNQPEKHKHPLYRPLKAPRPP